MFLHPLPPQGDDNLVSRLLKRQQLPPTSARSELAVFPLLSKLPNIKNSNPFSKKDAPGAASTPTGATAPDDAKKKEENDKSGEDKTAGEATTAADEDGVKVSLAFLSSPLLAPARAKQNLETHELHWRHTGAVPATHELHTGAQITFLKKNW